MWLLHIPSTSQRIISCFQRMKEDFITSWLVYTVWWRIWNVKLAPICGKAPWMMFVMRMEVPGAMTRRSHDTAERLLKHNALSSTSMTLRTHTHTGYVIQRLQGISFSKEKRADREKVAQDEQSYHYRGWCWHTHIWKWINSYTFKTHHLSMARQDVKQLLEGSA